MGTSRNNKLNKKCKNIWEWCIQKDVWLIPTYVKSSQNKANQPSRKIFVQGEWKLNSDILQKALIELKFLPDIDLFTSRLNNQFSKHVSYRAEPEAIAVDGFSIS